MFVVIGFGFSPLGLAAIAFGVMAALRAPWWAVLLTVAVCAVLAVVAALRLGAWHERRAGLATARWPVQQQLRAEVVAEPARQVPAAERAAIGPVYHFNFYGAAGDTHAAVIRKAITGTAGDARPEEE